MDKYHQLLQDQLDHLGVDDIKYPTVTGKMDGNDKKRSRLRIICVMISNIIVLNGMVKTIQLRQASDLCLSIRVVEMPQVL